MGDGSDSIDRWDGNEHVPIRVRAATVADASAVAAVHVSSWEGAYRGMIPDEWLDRRTVARQTAIWEELLGGVGDPVDGRLPWAAVAEDGDTLIGFVSLNVPSRDADADARTAEISALCVTLWVLEPNARARAFYERCGFADDGGRQTMGDSGPGELRMRRGL
jgi:hypothetical protein